MSDDTPNTRANADIEWIATEAMLHEPVMIVTLEEAETNESHRPSGTRTWTYWAENVRDFAWASSKTFAWDAAGFSYPAEDRVIAAPLFEGVEEFLDRNAVPMALASATPTGELRRIVAAKDIEGAFLGIEGSPTGKGEIVALDAKVAFDSSAAPRHKVWAELRDPAEEDPVEAEAEAAGA